MTSDFAVAHGLLQWILFSLLPKCTVDEELEAEVTDPGLCTKPSSLALFEGRVLYYGPRISTSRLLLVVQQECKPLICDYVGVRLTSLWHQTACWLRLHTELLVVGQPDRWQNKANPASCSVSPRSRLVNGNACSAGPAVPVPGEYFWVMRQVNSQHCMQRFVVSVHPHQKSHQAVSVALAAVFRSHLSLSQFLFLFLAWVLLQLCVPAKPGTESLDL